MAEEKEPDPLPVMTLADIKVEAAAIRVQMANFQSGVERCAGALQLLSQWQATLESRAKILEEKAKQEKAEKDQPSS